MTPADPPDREGHPVAANDNGGVDGPDPDALRKVNDVVLKLVRIIGRRMAREDFAARTAAANDAAANDNAPKSNHEPEHKPVREAEDED
jgi:hypothetical protein